MGQRAKTNSKILFYCYMPTITEKFIKFVTKKSLTKIIANFLFPASCLACGQRMLTSEPHNLCVDCWGRLRFITDPYCDYCCAPQDSSSSFFLPISSPIVCERCLFPSKKRHYTKKRAALIYDAASKQLIQRFKYQDDTILLHLFVKWLLIAGQNLFQNIDLVIPVPLHQDRMKERKYNQAALLAQELALRIDKPYAYDVLDKVINVIPQSSLTQKERIHNVKGAFALNNRKKINIENKSILLVDDVVTTSSTVNECSKILRKVGKVKHVFVISLAQTHIYKESFPTCD